MCLLMLLFSNCKIRKINQPSNRFLPDGLIRNLMHTFLSKVKGIVGNLTNAKKCSTDCSLSLKRSADVENIISSSITSQPWSSSALIPHNKIAFKTFSSDVTVKSGCCNTHNILCKEKI